MAMRMMARRLVNPTGEALFARSAVRREMSSGKVFQEEERAAETIYIKKMEQEKLEKLARKGFSQEEAKKAVSGHPDAHPEAVKIVNETASTTASTDSTTNYAVIGGIVGALALGYWYFSGSSDSKKKDDKE
ncbi:hypothetical protein M758_6G195300 [Ceratodon purpureus]|uniref:Uncharacterized protein n=1 Tax=Ceratodon purpureus TaxID=3225 RepID=A0A8T0HJN8_CERPU|nr:hypothetical protein KC19_6G204100 [Ceratodon purpureus]KAG0614678.1 hypothetical protein M758_6G195300 [Ceratodon purpureus]